MKKRLLLLIPVVFLLVMIALVIYWNPATTPVSISLNTFKIDRNCNQLGTVPIELTGNWIYPLFEDRRLDLTSTEFDGMSGLEIGSSTDTFPGDVPEQLPSLDLLRIWGEMFHKAKNQYELCAVVFSPDYERWMLAFREYDIFYVGSTNNEDTLEDLYEYFKSQIIGTWPADPNENNLYQYFGRWDTSDGKSSEPVDLVLKIEIQEKEDKRDVLDLHCELPEDFPYMFIENYSFYDNSYNGKEYVVPYYTSCGYTLNKETNEPEFVYFAYDKEKNWSLFVWEDSPEQYLIVSGKPNFDSDEILEHFKQFFDIFVNN